MLRTYSEFGEMDVVIQKRAFMDQLGALSDDKTVDCGMGWDNGVVVPINENAHSGALDSLLDDDELEEIEQVLDEAKSIDFEDLLG